MVVFCKMRVQAHAIVTRHFSREAHQVLADTEGRAGCHCHLRHGAMGCIVKLRNQTLCVFQNSVFLLNHAIGWQTAFGLTDAHAAACGHKAHANFARGMNAIV